MTDDDTRTWLKPEQVNELREASYTASPNPHFQSRNDALIALLYDAGLRPTELVDLTTDSIDLDDGILRLTSSTQKQYPTEGGPPPASIQLDADEHTNDTVRTIRQYLNNRDKDSMYLFCSKDSEHMQTRTVRYAIKQTAKEAGVKPFVGFEGRGEPQDISPYTFRHSVAYRLLSACDDYTIYDVRNRLRHSSVKTTEQHYDLFDVR